MIDCRDASEHCAGGCVRPTSHSVAFCSGRGPPYVIGLRGKLYRETDGYRMIEPSVTDPAWQDQVLSDRPTLVVAEGLPISR